MEDTAALPVGMELRFDRRACDSIRAAGLSFREVDRAVVGAAGRASVGSSFQATMREWVILGRRAGALRIDVAGVIRSHRDLDPRRTCGPGRPARG